MAAVLLSNFKRAKREYTEEDTQQNTNEGSVRTSFDTMETALQAAVNDDDSNLEGFHTTLDNRVDAMISALSDESTNRGIDYAAYKEKRDNQITAVENYAANIQAGEVAVGSLEAGELVIDGGSLKIDGFTLAAVVSGGTPFISVS